MEFEEATQLTQNTQGAVDPRRIGRNNSGLSDGDISDVICILHPCSPAAFRIVATTAERTPQNVLQNDGYDHFDDGLTQSVLEEQETFILGPDAPHQAMDLALRFSAPTRNPKDGFVFGRNANACDIVLATDTYKRVSNVHFSIFINSSGVLMLRDMSTNGTIVDEVVLKGKNALQSQTRMLSPGSIIQILSPKPEEIVKFIVRIPSREGHMEEYEAKFQAYMNRLALDEARANRHNMLTRRLAAAQPTSSNSNSIRAPLVQNQYGMQWSGGDKYNVVGLIGKGAFATVYQLATKNEGQLFAAKELEKRKFIKNGVLDRKLDNEMQIMKSVSHENIVQYVEYQDHTNHMYIIMEFVPCGDLQQYLGNHGPLTEDLAKRMAAQVFDALAYLHRKRITHRDIKPDNILIANLDPQHFTIKLSDFGLSKVVKDNDTFLKTFCGTLLWCAPEVFPHYDAHVAGKGKKRPRHPRNMPASKFHSYSSTVDIWSFGGVLWYSLCFKPPFEGVADGNGRGMFDKIMMTPLDATDLVKQGVSDDAVHLLTQMLNTDPAARPSPATCLEHAWFGGMQLVRDAEGGIAEDGLVSIVEEDEQDGEADEGELDVSSLSLDEQESKEPSQTSEVSIHSGSLEFLNPRESKRFKSDMQSYRDPEDMIDSSPELFYQSIPIIHQPEGGQASAAKPQRHKLFGEITQSALEDSTVFGVGTGNAVGTSDTSRDEHRSAVVSSDSQRGAVASPSLLGAESMVRELNMDSPHSGGSHAAEVNEPITPQTPGPRRPRSSGVNGEPEAHQDDITPKQPAKPVFVRQIRLPLPPSSYYDKDPSTHNLEHASKVSGNDYMGDPSFQKFQNGSHPAPASGSATDNEDDTDLDKGNGTDDTDSHPETTLSQFLKPPPRLGRLTSTPDSFKSITLNLSSRLSVWGRAPGNTHVYEDKNDTRISKESISIWFWAKDIDKIPEDDQSWIKKSDLHCIISTGSQQGILVNGVKLAKKETGARPFGRVYTGDVITVCQQTSDGGPGLRFVCEFFHGEGQHARPEKGPRFKIDMPGRSDRASRSADRVSVVKAAVVPAA
jgi:serine/threonine protein kinase